MTPSIYVYSAGSGWIKALGTAESPVVFRSTGVSGEQWDRIQIRYEGSSEQSIFRYCTFIGGDYGLQILGGGYAGGNPVTLRTAVENCTFSDMGRVGIMLHSEARSTTMWAVDTENRSVVTNCRFDNMPSAILLETQGAWSSSGGSANAYDYSLITGNVFSNITDQAVRMSLGQYPSGSGGQPKLINNTFVDCRLAIKSEHAWYNFHAVNNIFNQCTSAVYREASVSNTNGLDVAYNCFSNNETNFVNYPSSYGEISGVNANGTSCDSFYNIYADPLFNSGSVQPQAASPCRNGGTLVISALTKPYPDAVHGNMGALIPLAGAGDMDEMFYLSLLVEPVVALSVSNLSDGMMYQVVTTDSLTNQSWDVIETFTASNMVQRFVLPSPAEEQKFYRIITLP